MSDYPEHAKLGKIADKSQAIGEFLEWLPSQGLILSEYVAIDPDHEHSPKVLVHSSRPIRDLLALYFDIDHNRLEEEKRTMLDRYRELHEQDDRG